MVLSRRYSTEVIMIKVMLGSYCVSGVKGFYLNSELHHITHQNDHLEELA